MPHPSPKHPAPRYRTLLRVRFGALWLLAALLFAASVIFAPTAFAVIAGLLLLACGWATLALPGMYWQRMCHTCFPTWLKLERGLLWRVILMVPDGQVVGARLRRDPVERLLGLSTLVLVTTAGRVALPGLAREDAARLIEQYAAHPERADI